MEANVKKKGKIRMCKQFYRLTLDDYSMPGFCSFSTDYIGTMDDMASFMDALRNDERSANDDSRLIDAWNRYCEGNHDVTYNAAYQENKLLESVTCLGTADTTLTDYTWEHLNTWDCSYFMKCDRAENTHIWVSYEGKYRRCVKTRFSNLQYKNTVGDYVSLGGMFWGYPHMVEDDGNITYHRMYVMEKRFENIEEALSDMENFKKVPDIEYRNVLNDIFGDG